MSDRNSDEKVAMLEGELDNLRQRIAMLEQENAELKRGNWMRSPYQPETPKSTLKLDKLLNCL